jgi:hypothetical protein
LIRHDPYAVSPPQEPFDYIVDDEPLRRAPPGSPTLLETAHSALRLAPDSLFRNWRNECMTIREEIGLVHGLGPVAVLHINGAIFLYPRGFGADILDFEATVIDPAGEAIISVGVGGAHRAPVQQKLAKVLDWYRTEIKLRNSNSSPLLTVFELWTDGRPLRRAS